MLRKPLLTLLVALVLGGGFAFGLARLFVLRFKTGDVYPPYSSLRTDPLGTKALADALDELPGVEVRRNFKPLPKLRADRPVTLVYTGTPHRAVWTEQELAAFDAMVVTGTRAIFTFYPVEKNPTKADDEAAAVKERKKKEKKIEEEQSGPEKKQKKDASREKAGHEKADPFVDFATVAKRWGLAFEYLPEDKKRAGRNASGGELAGQLEPNLTWHSALCFRDLKPEWQVLYACEGKPVIIERRYGQGSIVLAADSFFMSNESLRKERSAKLLARFFSGPPLVIFDEESRGIRDDPGIASLARKYRLHGVVAGLLLLAAFFVWKNAVRFIPAYDPQSSEDDFIAGKESSEGFVNLLRRTIPASSVFESCIAEWRKAFAQNPRVIARFEQAWNEEPAIQSRARDPLAAYRALGRALRRKS